MKFSRQRATALKLITKYGQDVQINQISGENEDWNSASESSVPHTVAAVFFTMTKDKHETARLAGYDLTGSVYAMCPPFGYVPKPGDTLLRSGVSLTIEYVNTLAVNGEVIYHDVYLNGDVPKSITVL